MEKYDFILNLAIGVISFMLGWYISRKTGLRIKHLYHIKNLKKARKLYEIGNKEESLKVYKMIRDNIEEKIWFKDIDFLNLINIKLRERDFNECVRYCNLLYQAGKQIPWELKRSVVMLCNQNQAYRFSNDIMLLGKPEGGAEWHSLLGLVLAKNQQMEQAQKEIEKAMSMISPNDDLSLFNCAMTFQNLGAFGDAHRIYKKFTSNPKPNFDFLSHAYSNIGYICYQKANFQSKNRNFRKQIRLRKLGTAFNRKALQIIDENNLYEGFDLSSLIGNLLVETDDPDEQKYLVDLGLKSNSESPVLFNALSHYYRTIGNYKKALQFAKRSVKSNPENIKSLSNLAWAYYDNKSYEDTLETVRKAFKIDPDIEFGYFDAIAGAALSSLGKYSEGIKYLKIGIAKGFRKHVDYANCVKSTIHLLNKLGKYKESIPLCLEAVNVLPRDQELADLLTDTIKQTGGKLPEGWLPLLPRA